MKPNLTNLFKTVVEGGKTIWDTHGTKILFYGGVICTGVATVLAADGAIKAKEALDEAKEESEEPLTVKEQAMIVAPRVIPAIGVWSVGTLAQWGGFKAEVTNGASALAAYKLSEMARAELEKATQEKTSKAKMNEINKNIVAQHRELYPVRNASVINTGVGDALFFEPLSRTYFKSSVKGIEQAVELFNNKICIHENGEVPFNEWLDTLGLPCDWELGEDFIFTYENPMRVSFVYDKAQDGTPCGELYYDNRPEYCY